jgi:hypothetical protein
MNAPVAANAVRHNAVVASQSSLGFSIAPEVAEDDGKVP